MRINKPTYEWYAIYTKTNWEKKIYDSLKEQNIECYLPLKKSLRKWSDRKKWIEEPLFKSYVFVHVSNKEFFEVLKTSGVFWYVSFGGKAYPIPVQQIEDIKTLVAKSQNELVLTHEKIEKGTQAEVLYGPMQGMRGEIVEFHGQYRIVIRIESLGCCLFVNIDKENLRLLKTEEKQGQNTGYRQISKASANTRKTINEKSFSSY